MVITDLKIELFLLNFAFLPTSCAIVHEMKRMEKV